MTIMVVTVCVITLLFCVGAMVFYIKTYDEREDEENEDE
jgi:hypothetical protein